MTKNRLSSFITLIAVLLGVVLLLYPVAATQFNNFKQQQFAHEYNGDVLASNPEDLSADLEAARAYNSTLPGVPILDPYLGRVSDPESNEFARYEAQLGRFDVMARVRVPEADIDLPVRHGTSDPVLDAGAGHLYGTSLPVGGIGTHAVVTSHTGLPEATLFDNLIDVDKGDLMFIDVLGETLAYEVDQIKVVLPEEIGDLESVAGHDYLTLFTCTPYGVNSHRLLVRGERVDYTETMQEEFAASDSFTWSIQGWMWLFIIGALAGLVAFFFILKKERKSKDEGDLENQEVLSVDAST